MQSFVGPPPAQGRRGLRYMAIPIRTTPVITPRRTHVVGPPGRHSGFLLTGRGRFLLSRQKKMGADSPKNFRSPPGPSGNDRAAKTPGISRKQTGSLIRLASGQSPDHRRGQTIPGHVPCPPTVPLPLKEVLRAKSRPAGGCAPKRACGRSRFIRRRRRFASFPGEKALGRRRADIESPLRVLPGWQVSG